MSLIPHVVVIVWLCLNFSRAFPNFFVENYATHCSEHPAQGYAGHGNPTQSCQDTDLQLADSQGSQVFCPGSAYNLQVSFSEARHFLLTSQNVVLPSTDCNGYRYVWGQGKGQVPSKSLKVQIPCGVTGSVGFKVTSASNPDDSYHQCELFYTLSSNCSTEICANTPSPDPSAVLPMTTQSPGGASSTTTIPQQPAFAACQGLCSKFLGTESAKCQSSNSGYGCSKKMEELTLHWVISSCVPSNKCTQDVSWLTPCNAQEAGPLLHILAEAPVAGYIAVSFATKSTSMVFADAVVGYIGQDGKSSINAYPISQYSVNQYSRYSTAAGFLSYSGIVRLSNGRLMLCFARRLKTPTAIYSPDLQLNDSVNINWATSSYPRMGKHDKARSTKVNLATGELQDLSNQHASARQLHSVLMLLDWALLMPLAVLFARHKQQFSQRIGGMPVWVVVHIWLQVLAFTCLITGTAVVLLPSKLNDSQIQTGWFAAHGVLALIVTIGNIAQLGSALLRPNNTSPYKPMWRRVHASSGAFLFLLAACNSGIGIHLMRVLQGDAVWIWTLPLLLCYLFIACLEIIFSRRSAQVQDIPAPAVVYIGSRLPRVGSMQMLLQRTQSTMQRDGRSPVAGMAAEVFLPVGEPQRSSAGSIGSVVNWREDSTESYSPSLQSPGSCRPDMSTELYQRNHLPPLSGVLTQPE